MKTISSKDASLFLVLLRSIDGVHIKLKQDMVANFSDDVRHIAQHFVTGAELSFDDQIWAEDIRKMMMPSEAEYQSQIWDNYRDNFPTRYIDEGYFDVYLAAMLRIYRFKEILDVGGGELGTQVLKDASKANVYLLDPYVEKVPAWMTGKAHWNRYGRYDLIVARGSINYLTDQELYWVKTWLNDGGHFVANTFLTPPSTEWTERPYETVSGIKGIERFRYSAEHKVVQHELIPSHGDKISHRFFYRSREDYENIFGKVRLMEHKTNSVILHFRS